MQKILSLGIVLALLFVPMACGPLDEPAQSTVAITSNVKFNACGQANYTRVAPNFCANDNFASVGLTSDNTCRSIGASSWPTGTTAVLLAVQHTFWSAAAVATRQIDTSFFTDSGCTVSAGRQMSVRTREWVALALAAMFDYNYSDALFRVNTTQTQIWYKSLLTLCVNCSVAIQVTGYYD